MSSDARVPAWKRLGLKLKAGADTQADSAAPSQKSIASPDTTPSGSAKRKSSGSSAQDPYAKKPRREDTNNATTAKTKPKTPKSVSFAAETEELAPPKPATNGQKVPKRQKQKSEKPITETPKGTQPNTAVKPLVKKQNAVANLQSAIEYLRQWHTARDSWKFNKNHQTRLLEYVFSDETTIPAVDINVFYEYIRPLKGFVRKRLRQTAAEVKSKDMEKGSEAFSASGKEAAARKQQEYEGVIAGYLEQERTPGKRRFEEMDYVLRTADMEMQRRVVKRMRAEMILDELPESDDSESSTGTATLTETETETETENTTGEGSAEGQAANSEGDKRIKLNDGSQRRLRRNKVRTVEVEDDSSSSSEDDSDSESDTSSSGSESSSHDESDSENAMDVDPARNEEETSSSSSSSSSESDSDSDDDSSEEEA